MIISYMSNIDGLACSHHIDDRIPYLFKQGVDVRMITSFFAPKNLSYNQSRVFFVHPEEIRNYLRFKLKPMIRNRSLYAICMNLIFLPFLPFKLLLRIILPNHDVSIWWALPAYVAMRKQCSVKKPDLLYSTGGSHSAHLAAAWVSKHTGIPWVAEFQDPPVHGFYCKSKSEGKFINWMEKMIMRKANKVVFLTENAKNSSEARTEVYGKGITIYPGSNPIQYHGMTSDQENRSIFKISHIGSLGGNRNLRNFLEALERAMEKEPRMISEVQLEIVGGIDRELKKHFEEFKHKNLLNIGGKLPRAFVAERIINTDLLLLVQGIDVVSSGQIPCKTYEYLFTKKPILGLLYHNDELADMLLKRGHYTAKADDVDDIRNAILNVYARWKEGTLYTIRGPSPITIQGAVDHIVKVFDQSMSNP